MEIKTRDKRKIKKNIGINKSRWNRENKREWEWEWEWAWKKIINRTIQGNAVLQKNCC